MSPETAYLLIRVVMVVAFVVAVFALLAPLIEDWRHTRRMR